MSCRLAKVPTGVPGVLLKGWQTNGIVSLRTGFPFTATVPAGDLNTGNDGSPVRPDRLQDGRRRLPYAGSFGLIRSAFQRVTCNIPSAAGSVPLRQRRPQYLRLARASATSMLRVQELSVHGAVLSCSSAASCSTP